MSLRRNPALERRVVSSDGLMLALDQFGRAVHDRVETKTEESDAEYQRADSELDRASEDFLTQAAALRDQISGEARFHPQCP